MDVDKHTERWDIISLSLVVNFVPEPKDRGNSVLTARLTVLMLAGRMLVLAHAFLRPSGLLFLAVSLQRTCWLRGSAVDSSPCRVSKTLAT